LLPKQDIVSTSPFTRYLFFLREMMKAKHVKVFLLFTVGEGIMALLFFMSRRSDQESARLFGFSYLRLGMAGADLIILGLLALVTFKALRDARWSEGVTQRVARYLEESIGESSKRLFTVQGGFIIALVALIEAFFLTWCSIPPPLRPMIAWAILICVQAWLILRIVYASDYRKRPSLVNSIRSIWQSWTPVQRKVFFILSGIGLVYFLVFIPVNISGLGADELVILPDVLKMLIPGATFQDTIQRLFINEYWWYGQPYFPLSAAALIIPRLVFGIGFVAHRQINLLFLRQLISVLPMILSIFMLVYIVTRFKSVIYSISMYVFLLLVPGVVKYCYRFWHPDSLILFFVILTIFFLQRDRLRFKRNFFFAAVTCGLAVAIKLWGFFFFLSIGGYLLAGLLRKVLTFKKAILAGLIFILVMSATIVLSSPSLFVPRSFQFMVQSLQTQNDTNMQGYGEPDSGNLYQKGLANWVHYFGVYYMRGYFFYFAFFALAVGALVGPESYLNRILLSWCAVTTLYLVTFLAVKSFQYMLPMIMPLYASAFLFPAIAKSTTQPKQLAFLSNPLTHKILLTITIALCVSQFIFNLIDIFTSPWIAVFA
jgi:hypothetical protein